MGRKYHSARASFKGSGEKWRHATLSLLTGFIAGSLLIIWPWKTKKYLLGDNGEFALRKGEKILTDFKWYLPEWNEELALAALIMLAGVGLVPLLELDRQQLSFLQTKVHEYFLSIEMSKASSPQSRI